VFGGVKAKTTLPKEPFSSLKLDQEVQLTDMHGVLNPKMIMNLIPSNNIKIYLADGTVLTGMVKETSMENNQVFKVFGEMSNRPNTGFGFVITKDGVFAGAVVFRDTEETHTVKYSEEAKGYVLVKSLGKKFVPSSMKIERKYLDLL
jgi:hypothetical protein